MPAIKIEGFSGIVPRTGPTLLETTQAQAASDVKLQSGELRPWRKEVFASDSQSAGTHSIYKALGPAGATQWVTWPTDVDVVNSPTGDATDYRFYYTGAGTPKKSNWALLQAAGGLLPQGAYEMGVPAPAGAPTLSATGGTAPSETRAYIYTFVSHFGALTEESPPSPAAMVTCNAAGATVTINGFSAPPAGAYNITAIRIYRSVTGATSTVYKQVTEIPISTATYDDTAVVSALGAELSSLYYTPPPADLIGLVSMPNGMMAGFVGNEIWFCEPYLPHAWPAAYVLTTEFPVVGLGVFGTTLVVTTTKNPYTITGTHPAVMTQEKLSLTQACVSKRSIAFDQHGVVYASPYGLVAIGAGLMDVITTPIMTADDWQQLNPSTLSSILFGNYYLGFYDSANTRSAFVITRNTGSPLMGGGNASEMSSFSFPASALFLERTTGYLYACSYTNNAIYQLDASTLNNTQFLWKSKQFVGPAPMNFATLQVNADFIYLNDDTANAQAQAEWVATNTELYTTLSAGLLEDTLNSALVNVHLVNGSALLDSPKVPDPRFVTVTVSADGKVVMAKNIKSYEALRMPAGFKAFDWEVTITGNVPVRSFAMATTMTELKLV